MTKQECIDEITKYLDDLWIDYSPSPKEVAEALYNAGYRKIDDKCAVITKDDLNLYKKQREEIDILTKVYASSKRKQTKKQLLETIAEYEQKLENGELVIKEQKAEIERLTKDKSFATRKMMESKAKAVELQKQVDELTERYLEESKERCEFEQKYKKIQHAHNIGLGTQRSHWGKKVEQAVKDTAKEIYGEIEKSDILIVDTQEYGEIEVVSIERLNEIFRSKGVEVEE